MSPQKSISTSKKVQDLPATKPQKMPAQLSANVCQALDAWLKGRRHWNHQDWLDLLQLLKTKHGVTFIGEAEGQRMIGEYLETHRKNF